MKFHKTKLAVATMLALATQGVNAATIDIENVVVNILSDDGTSMLIDTNVATRDFFDGTITSWTSNTDLTSAINSFIAGATDVSYWVGGRFTDGLDKYAATSIYQPSSQAVNALVDTNLPAFMSNAEIGQFVTATVGLTEDWKAGIPAGDPAHFTNPNTNGLVGITDMGVATPFLFSQSGFFTGTNEFARLDWNLAADGALSYGASVVPVPAAVWLFGTGLLGLVGVARRNA